MAQALARPDSPVVRAERFSTIGFDERRQFAHWRRFCAPIGDIRQAVPSKSGFSATVQGFDLGSLHIATLKSDGFAYERSMQCISARPLDHWCLVLRHAGVETSRVGGRVLRETAGTLSLKSLAIPVVGECNSADCTCVFFKRDQFPHLTHLMDQARHTELTGQLAELLAGMLGTITTYLQSLTFDDVPAISTAISELLEATLKAMAKGNRNASEGVASSQLDQALRYIQVNLTRRDLCVDDISRALSISRRQLYYLFKPHGGVATFIRLQRLAASHAALVTAWDHRRIGAIAYDFGFSNLTEFGRQFRGLYGYSPSEAAEAQTDFRHPQAGPPRSLTDWLSTARSV